MGLGAGTHSRSSSVRPCIGRLGWRTELWRLAFLWRQCWLVPACAARGVCTWLSLQLVSYSQRELCQYGNRQQHHYQSRLRQSQHTDRISASFDAQRRDRRVARYLCVGASRKQPHHSRCRHARLARTRRFTRDRAGSRKYVRTAVERQSIAHAR